MRGVQTRGDGSGTVRVPVVPVRPQINSKKGKKRQKKKQLGLREAQRLRLLLAGSADPCKSGARCSVFSVLKPLTGHAKRIKSFPLAKHLLGARSQRGRAAFSLRGTAATVAERLRGVCAGSARGFRGGALPGGQGKWGRAQRVAKKKGCPPGPSVPGCSPAPFCLSLCIPARPCQPPRPVPHPRPAPPEAADGSQGVNSPLPGAAPSGIDPFTLDKQEKSCPLEKRARKDQTPRGCQDTHHCHPEQQKGFESWGPGCSHQ